MHCPCFAKNRCALYRLFQHFGKVHKTWVPKKKSGIQVIRHGSSGLPLLLWTPIATGLPFYWTPILLDFHCYWTHIATGLPLLLDFHCCYWTPILLDSHFTGLPLLLDSHCYWTPSRFGIVNKIPFTYRIVVKVVIFLIKFDKFTTFPNQLIIFIEGMCNTAGWHPLSYSCHLKVDVPF